MPLDLGNIRSRVSGTIDTTSNSIGRDLKGTYNAYANGALSSLNSSLNSLGGVSPVLNGLSDAVNTMSGALNRFDSTALNQVMDTAAQGAFKSFTVKSTCNQPMAGAALSANIPSEAIKAASVGNLLKGTMSGITQRLMSSGTGADKKVAESVSLAAGTMEGIRKNLADDSAAYADIFNQGVAGVAENASNMNASHVVSSIASNMGAGNNSFNISLPLGNSLSANLNNMANSIESSFNKLPVPNDRLNNLLDQFSNISNVASIRDTIRNGYGEAVNTSGRAT